MCSETTHGNLSPRTLSRVFIYRTFSRSQKSSSVSPVNLLSWHGSFFFSSSSFSGDSMFQRWPFDHLIRSSLPCDSLTVLPLSLQLILPDPLVLSQLRSSRTPRTDVFSHSAWLDLSLRTKRGLYKPGSDSSFVTLITNRPPFLFLSHILALLLSSSLSLSVVL